ncbi:MAG: hypothetical protein ACXAE3_14375 [Candidatus Kariarchaeaceae archaeon]|jgi:hypothetical protein
MTYQGQLIYTTELGHTLAFANYRQKVKGFTRFLQVSFVILSLLVINRGRTTFSAIDYLVWIGFSALVIFFLQSTIDRFQATDDFGEESVLSVFEYGISLPRDLTDLEADLYLTYNQITSIEVEEDRIILDTEATYVIPFFFVADEELDVIIPLFEKISTKVAAVENKDYPTIIPKAFFKDII